MRLRGLINQIIVINGRLSTGGRFSVEKIIETFSLPLFKTVLQ